MTRIRNVAGTITKTTVGNHNIYSEGNIVQNAAGTITETGEEKGVSFNKPKTYKPKTDLKITKVEGPFDENNKLVKIVKKGVFYTYKATPSRKLEKGEEKLLKWATKNDDEIIKELPGISSLNKLAQDGKIIIDIVIKVDCEKARIYAYFKKASEKASVEIILSLVKIIITNKLTGYTIQSLKGEDYFFSDPVVIVPTYKVNVLSFDNDNKNGKVEFSFNVTRDAWYNMGKNTNGEYKLLNRVFVPANVNQNLYGVFWIPSYPNQLRYAKSGMDAFIFTRFGKRKIPAKPLKTQLKSDGKKIDDFIESKNFATDVMIHIGGTYELKGFDHVGGSYGCFGFIPEDDIYINTELAKKASKNDDYDDKTSNSDWKKVANKIVNLSFTQKIPLRILLENRNEELNYYPTEVLSE